MDQVRKLSGELPQIQTSNEYPLEIRPPPWSERSLAQENFTHILSDSAILLIPLISAACGTGVFVPLLRQMRRSQPGKSQFFCQGNRSFQSRLHRKQKELPMPQTELQGLTAVFTSEATFRPGRRAKFTTPRNEALASTVHGICAEEHVFNWQSLWIDVGGEG